MRIVFVSTGTLVTFGSTYQILGLGPKLALHGIDTHLLLPGWPENRERFPDSQFQGVPIHFTETGAWGEMQSKYEFLQSLDPDVVHCIAVNKRCFLPSLSYRKMSRSKLIVEFDEYFSRLYSFPKKAYFVWAERSALRHADSIVVMSRFLEQQFGQSRSRSLLYMPNAVEVDLFQKQRHGSEEIRRKWPNRKLVTYFGSLRAEYDADLVFDMAVRVLEKRRDVVFLFVGTGPLLEEFRRRTAELGLQDYIQWCGFVPDEDVPKYLAASDALVFPIRDNLANRARCPGKTYYYIAAMVPIVTNRVGEVVEALGDRAWYFQDGSVADFAETLERCLGAGESGPRPDADMAARNSWEDRAQKYMRFVAETLAR